MFYLNYKRLSYVPLLWIPIRVSEFQTKTTGQCHSGSTEGGHCNPGTPRGAKLVIFNGITTRNPSMFFIYWGMTHNHINAFLGICIYIYVYRLYRKINIWYVYIYIRYYRIRTVSVWLSFFLANFMTLMQLEHYAGPAQSLPKSGCGWDRTAATTGAKVAVCSVGIERTKRGKMCNKYWYPNIASKHCDFHDQLRRECQQETCG
jgi:hypothetical protein